MKDLKFTIYIIDTETSGLSAEKHDIIELSAYRLNDNIQKTWYMKPLNPDTIDVGALRVNGYNINEILGKTPEGAAKYLDPMNVLPDIEMFFMEDGMAAEDRIFAGQFCEFDYQMMKQLWKKCDSENTFPFGARPHMLDTKQIELFLDLCRGERSKYYNLSSLVEKYGVKKEKAHLAEFDTKMTKDVLLSQMNFVSKAIK